MKRASIAILALAALLLTGCAGTADEATSELQSAATSVEETVETPAPEAEKMSAANSVDITAPGEVCDPQNMNDPICAAFYPDQVVLNVTARSEDLTGMSEAEKIAAAQQACTDGGAPSLVTAGQLAYCPEQLDQRLALTIAYYQALGEEGAKADFADKTMPTAEEIGL